VESYRITLDEFREQTKELSGDLVLIVHGPPGKVATAEPNLQNGYLILRTNQPITRR
jgi:hypothetical protein